MIPILSKLLNWINSKDRRDYFLAGIIILALVFLEYRLLIFESINYIGKGYFKFSKIPFTLKESFQFLPLILIDWASLPGGCAVTLLAGLYHLLGGLAIFAFIRIYLKDLFKENNLFLPAFLGTLLFMFYPWNTTGDNFPTLVMVRFLFPLALLCAFKGIKHNSTCALLLSGIIISLATLADPRAIVFFIPIIFFVILLPHLLIRETGNLKLYLFRFIGLLVISTIFSSLEIAYRVLKSFSAGKASIPTTVASAFNPDSFIPNFKYADLISTFQGISFLATGEQFLKILKEIPFLYNLFLIAPLLAVAVIFMILLKYHRTQKLRAHILSLVLFILIVIGLFSRLVPNKLPLFPRIACSFVGSKIPGIITSLFLLFRTERFLNLSMMIFLGLSAGISIKLLRNSRNSFFKILFVSGVLVSVVVVWGIPVIMDGHGLVNRGGIIFEIDEESLALSKVISDIKPYSVIDKSIPLQKGSGGLPNAHFLSNVEAGVKQFLVRYSTETSKGFRSPILIDKDYDFLAHLLNQMGVKYLILNGYRAEPNDPAMFKKELNQSPYFRFRSKSGSVYGYEIQKEIKPKIADGLFVLGGLEDYRKAYPFFEKQNLDVAPIFLDAPVDFTVLKRFHFPLLVSTHKTKTDLIASFCISHKDAEILTPAKWKTGTWNRFVRWSPGYIMDTISGMWSHILPDLINYEWSYTYRPDYGNVFVINAESSISTEVNLNPGKYRVLIRVLMNPRGGVINLKLGGFSKDIVTKWDYDSSEFIWKDLGVYDFTGSKLKVILRSFEGVNAVNLIVAIPQKDWEEITKKVKQFIKEREIIYIVDPERQRTNPTDGSVATEMKLLKSGSYKASSLSNVKFEIIQDSILQSNNQITYFQGKYITISFPKYRDILFSSFFEKEEGLWTDLDSRFSVSYVNDGYVGKSILVSTTTQQPGSWSWIKGPLIEVKPNHKYQFKSAMKWENVVQSHISIDGIKKDGSVVRLGLLPSGKDGESDWVEYSTIKEIPSDIVKVRFVLNAGWAEKSDKPAKTWFDNILIKRLKTSKKGNQAILLHTSELGQIYNNSDFKIVSYNLNYRVLFYM